jgi:hypothetical protein
MIGVSEAKAKLTQLAPKLSDYAKLKLGSIINGQESLSREAANGDEHGHQYMFFIEDRLAAEHLAYLEKSQVNGVWGQSLTEAFSDLAARYGFKWSGVLDSQIMRALLDGQKSAKPKESLEPNSYSWLRQLVEKRGHEWVTEKGHINIVAIRGYMLPKGPVANVPNIYNDTFFLAWIDSTGRPQVVSFVGSTDPGRYYYAVRRLQPEGCAYLPAGQYVYVRGRHITASSNYPALNPKNGWVNVYRVGASGVPHDNKLHRADWINVHAGVATVTVDVASAGCPTIQSAGPLGWQWKRFWGLVEPAPNKEFLFTVIESSGI